MTNEASVTRDFKHWLEKNKPSVCTTFEFKIIKLDKKKSFAFNQVADHQIEYLLASLKGFWYKIVDSASVGGFSSPKPFDAVWCKAEQAYVVPIFYLPHKVKTAVLIPIENFVVFKKNWAKKSVHLEDLDTFRNIKL
jgi:hypothetical protein